MALTVGTNSYVSVSEAEAFFSTSMKASTWDSLDESSKEAALITATREIDQRAWIGTAASPTQKLGWPRKGASYFDERLGLAVHPSTADIPERVKMAVYEQAIYLLENGDVLSATGQIFESITVGPISLTDADSKRSISAISKHTYNLLAPLTKIKSQGNMWWRAN